MNQDELRTRLLSLARRLYEEGPGYAQESVVLRTFAEELKVREDDLAQVQEILTAWHRLFFEGELSWGYDLDNPGSPWYHIPRKKAG